jgi:toxin secretion/phage lysis holin
MGIFKGIFAAIGGFLGWFLGGFDSLVIALVIFIVCDYITGVIYGIKCKKLSSSTGFWGLAKKAVIIIIVGVAATVDNYILGVGAAFRTATIFFYLANEGISILENCSKLGLPIPQKLQNVLEQIKNKEDKQ